MADRLERASEATQGTINSEPTPENGSQEEASGNAGPARDSATPRAPLPQYWEELTSSDGKTFYANHAARTTTWRRPGGDLGGDGANIQTGLPPAWQALVDIDGRTYYANHESRTTTFERPKGPAGELPAGWEMLYTPEGIAYFANHNVHITTWGDPRSA